MLSMPMKCNEKVEYGAEYKIEWSIELDWIP